VNPNALFVREISADFAESFAPALFVTVMHYNTIQDFGTKRDKRKKINKVIYKLHFMTLIALKE
jgi:hypothetical protein